MSSLLLLFMVRLTAALVILMVGTVSTDAVAQSVSSRASTTSLFAATSAGQVSASHNVRIRLRRFQQFSDAGIRVLGTTDDRQLMTVRAIRLFTNGRDARVLVSYGEESQASMAVRQNDPTLFASTNQADVTAPLSSSQLFLFPIPTPKTPTTRYITVTQ